MTVALVLATTMMFVWLKLLNSDSFQQGYAVVPAMEAIQPIGLSYFISLRTCLCFMRECICHVLDFLSFSSCFSAICWNVILAAFEAFESSAVSEGMPYEELVRRHVVSSAIF
jgi:hypothetical protein